MHMTINGRQIETTQLLTVSKYRPLPKVMDYLSDSMEPADCRYGSLLMDDALEEYKTYCKYSLWHCSKTKTHHVKWDKLQVWKCMAVQADELAEQLGVIFQ